MTLHYTSMAWYYKYAMTLQTLVMTVLFGRSVILWCGGMVIIWWYNSNIKLQCHNKV